jgi:exodeoxyribonuclease VII large subunit
MEPIGLYRLNGLVKQALKERFTGTVWVVAEIADIKENRSGHCYMELVEKREADDTIIASSRATMWSFAYRTLKPAFEATTGKSLQRGMKVLLEVEVTFHELYSYSLNVKNIDPSFTLGDLERKRREIVERLTREGVIDMNRELPFPVLPKSVAVISSPTAAGYGDFEKQLRENPYGYAFYTCLFPAVMQGEKSAESIIGALDRVHAAGELFDVVVIIRGGGSQVDMSCFDSYELALNVAQFPLPVITGIGHERDESIVDRVAYKNVKTPTAAAALLVELFHEADSALEVLHGRLLAAVERLLAGERQRQGRQATAFKQLTRSLLDHREARLSLASQKIGRLSKLFVQHCLGGFAQLNARVKGRLDLRFDRHRARLEELLVKGRVKAGQLLVARKHQLELAETKIISADPRRVLERGFSITRVNGKAVRGVTGIKSGDRVETELFDGRVESEVKAIKDNH